MGTQHQCACSLSCQDRIGIHVPWLPAVRAPVQKPWCLGLGLLPALVRGSGRAGVSRSQGTDLGQLVDPLPCCFSAPNRRAPWRHCWGLRSVPLKLQPTSGFTLHFSHVYSFPVFTILRSLNSFYLRGRKFSQWLGLGQAATRSLELNAGLSRGRQECKCWSGPPGLPGVSRGWSQAWSQDLSPGTLSRDTGVPAAWPNCWATHPPVSLPGAPEAQRGDCFFVGSVIFDCACMFFAILSLGFLDTLRRGFVFAWVRCLGA